nr:kelch-like protein 10 [Rhipicephalus microplus]
MANVALSLDEDSLLPEVREALWNTRCTDMLCDGLLKTDDGGEFAVHKVIMATCSEYFRALFGCRKIKETRSEALIPGVIKQTMAIIVEFAYKRMTRVDCDNVESLLEAADYLCVMGIIKDCCDFLVSIMTPENCISIRNVAKLYNCSGPHHEGLQVANPFDLSLIHSALYLMQNFIEVSERGEELLHLEIDEVEAIMSDENLNVIKEETVWKAVIRWIDFDSDNRKQYISRLFKCVRMGLVDTDFFVEKIKACKYVADDEACRPLVVETLRFLYDLDVMVHNQQVPTPLFVRPRIPREVVFIVGGWNAGGPTAVVETYDTKADRWIDVHTTDPFGPCAYHKCAVVGFEIYVIGGFNGEDYYSRVRCFNAHTKEWRSVNPMHVKRCYVSVAVLNEIIYAMGGFDGRNRHNTVEKFDTYANQWTMIAPMHVQRSDACATAHGGYVYVTGGFSGNECLSSAERYDPLPGQWTVISSMRFRRSGVGCIGFLDCVYAVGGFNGSSRLCSAEKYNPETNRWTTLPTMNSSRSNFAMAVIDNLVFAIGGFNGRSTINLAECYDHVTDQWYEATDMTGARSALAACVISGLPNIRDYIHQHPDNLMEEKRQKMLEILRQRSRLNTRDINDNS